MARITPETHPQEFITRMRRVILEQRDTIKSLNAELTASQQHNSTLEKDYRGALDRISRLKGVSDETTAWLDNNVFSTD